MANQPKETTLTSVVGDKELPDDGRQPLSVIGSVTPNYVLPALADLEDLPALQDILPPGEQQDEASSPVSGSAKHSGEKDTTPKDSRGPPRSMRGSKDARSPVMGSKVRQGSIKGSGGTRGSSKGSKDASGSVQGSKRKQGSMKKNENALAALEEGKDEVQTMASSNAAPDSPKGSKKGASKKGSKDASGSAQGSKGTQALVKKNENALAPLNEVKDIVETVESITAAPGSSEGTRRGGSIKGSKDASGSVQGSKGKQGFLLKNENTLATLKEFEGGVETVESSKAAPDSTVDSKKGGSKKRTKDTQGSTQRKDPAGSTKSGEYAAGSRKRSNYAVDSVKATKGTKYESDSRNVDDSDNDRSLSSSKETHEAPLKFPTVVTFQEVPVDDHKPVPTSPSPVKPQRHSLIVLGVVALVAILLLLILMMLMRGSAATAHTSDVPAATCTSEHCQKVARLLLDSVAPDVNPCENFYLRVCGGWKYAGSQGEVLFQKLAEDVTVLLRNVTVPATGQSPTEKAALAYQACEDVVTKNNTNVTTLLQILEEAGLYSPPGWTGPLDALNATFYLHFRWRIAAPMKFTYVRHTDRGITLRMAPSESLKAYARRRKKPGYYDDVRKEYEFFQTTYEQNKLPHLTYDDWKKIDETIIADSTDALQEANSMKNFSGWNESTVRYAIRGVSKQQWTGILKTYLNHSGALRFYVDSLFLFKKFIEMPLDVGNAVAQAYHRWYLSEVLMRRVYAPWIIKDFPSFDEALKYHRGYCFAIIEQAASFALLAPYIKKTFKDGVKDDIVRLLKMVRGAYNDVFDEGIQMRSGVNMMPMYTNGTGHLFDRLMFSEEKYLTESYALYEDMTSDTLQNWRRLMIGRSRTLWTRVSLGVAGLLPAELLYYEIDGVSNEIILRPDVAVLPVYDSGAPLVLKLASLGSLMASAMAKVLYATQENTARWHATANCIFSKQEQSANSTGGKIVVLERVIALAVTVLAAMTGTKDDEPLTLPGIADLSGMQLLFALWCYQQCGEKAGERLCNEPIREIGVFADVFHCGVNTMMRRDSACSAAWFKPLNLGSTTPGETTVSGTNTQPDNSTNAEDAPLSLRAR